MSIDVILQYIARFLALLLVIPLHECAHAYAAVKNGDETPRFAGRLTLNPLAHFDLYGCISFILVGFGWAKPVPINPNNFKNIKKGYFQTAVAGVIVNYITAFVFYPLLILINILFTKVDLLLFDELIIKFFDSVFVLSLCFFVFNLLPFNPLDGYKVLEVVVHTRGKIMSFFRDYGHYILLGLMVVSMLANRIKVLQYIDILGYFMSFAVNIVGRPITLLWNWVFGLII